MIYEQYVLKIYTKEYEDEFDKYPKMDNSSIIPNIF